MFRHALRNGLIPILTMVGIQLGNLLAGAVVTETIFSWPGLGQLLIQAINARDYPLVQGCVLAVALTYVTVNLLTDVCYSVVDPRIRYE
jgi:ABC-type dipeptide/oligopeptide/nickel transport system permease component